MERVSAPRIEARRSGPRVGARSGFSGAYTAVCSPYREGVGSVDLRACRGALVRSLVAFRSHLGMEGVPPNGPGDLNVASFSDP
jgi:hypothetical protein